jgi:hypothetical protein
MRPWDLTKIDDRPASNGGAVLLLLAGQMQFIHMIDLMGVADGPFSEGKSLIFPSDMEGVPGQVVLANNSFNDTDKLRKRDLMERINTYRFWRWDGKRLPNIGQRPVVKRCMIAVEF